MKGRSLLPWGLAALFTVVPLYVLWVFHTPVCTVHPGVVPFSSLGRAERAVLPEEAGALRHAWYADGLTYVSVTRFEVPSAELLRRRFPFRPATPADAARLTDLPPGLQQPWWLCLPLPEGAEIAVPAEKSLLLLLPPPADTAYLMVREEE